MFNSLNFNFLRITGVIIPSLFVSLSPLHADVIAIDAKQVGAFYADGSHDNSTDFQNYFVGYGTTPGFPRTEERRSFFVFDLTAVTGKVTAADFSIRLKDFGVIFGKDCLGSKPCTGPLPALDDPATSWDDTDPGAWPTDLFEEFVVGYTPIPSAIVTDVSIPDDVPGLGIGGIDVFDSFAATPISAPFVFTVDDVFDFSEGSAEIVISLTESGIDLINDALGEEIVLSGWMPSFSFEDRTTPTGDALVEKSELVFGLTDLVTGGTPTGLPSPFLELTIVPVPATFWLYLSAVTLLARRMRQGNGVSGKSAFEC